ncbi:hypothetical protein D3C86_1441170 [compost metagenome]
MVASAVAWLGTLMPSRLGNWPRAMTTAAPRVKPSTTECETKFTRAPKRSRPSSHWNSPARKLSNRIRAMKSSLPGVARGLTLVNRTMEIAAVGPQIRCQDEPHRQATITGTMAAYRPYSAGSPAIRA